MAIDPGIIAGVALPAPQPQQNALTTLTQIESVKALKDQREALASERMQQAQALVQKAKDTAATNAALQQAQGDYGLAGDILTKGGNGTLAGPLYDAATARSQKMAAALEAHNKASKASLDTAAQIMSTMGDSPEHYQSGLTAVKSLMTDPDDLKAFAAIAPDNPNPADIPGIVDRLTKFQVGAQALFTQHSKNVDEYLNGNKTRALASQMAITPPAERADMLKTMLAMEPDYSTRQALQAQFVPLLTATPDALHQMSLTSEQKSNAANAAQQRKDAEAVSAETHRHNVEQEAIERLKANGQLTPDGAPSEAVKQYADDLVKGNITIMGVPAAGKMRDSVEAYMRAQHFDMTRPLTAQVEARVEFAQAQMPQIDAVEAMAKEIDRQGLMGTFAGRFRDLASKESTPADIAGLTPDQRTLIGKFVTQADLLSSGVAMTHFGARASGDAVNMMRERLDPKGKDLQTYLGSIEGARAVMQGYADLKPGKANNVAASTGGVPADVMALLKDKPPLVYNLKGPDGQTHQFQKKADGSIVEVIKK